MSMKNISWAQAKLLLNFFRPAFRIHLAALLLAVVMAFALKNAAFAEAKKPVEIFVGIYPLKIHKLNLKEEQFEADFYIWFRWNGQKNFRVLKL